MEIKIELPGNVKVSCPTAHCAITILRCVSYRAEHATHLVNGVASGAPRSAKNVNPLGWQTIGSGLDGRGDGWVNAADDDPSREEDDYTVEDAEFEEEVIAAQVVNRDEGDDLPEDIRRASDAGVGFPHIPYGGPSDEDEDGEEEEIEAFANAHEQQSLPGIEQEPTSLEEDEDLSGERTRCAPPVRTHRSRVSASLFSGREEEDDESMFQGKGAIYQPIEHRLGDRAKAVFDFIQDRLVFSTEDIRKYAAEELKLEINKKNKKKLRKALKVIKRAGLIEKTGKGEWKMVG